MNDAPACPVPAPPDFSGVTVVRLASQPPLKDYLEAMRRADAEAAARFGERGYMLLS